MKQSNTLFKVARRHRASIVSVTTLVAVVLTGSATVIGQPSSTQPADAAPTSGSVLAADSAGGTGKISLSVNKSSVIKTLRKIDRVSVGNPEIADVNVIAADTLLVTAKRTGTTQVMVWDDNRNMQSVDVQVVNDLQQLQDQLTKLFPDSKIEVSGANGAIALRGRVPSLEVAQQASQLAAPYSSGENKVLNFLEISGGQQVMLQVKFAEVSRNASSSLGVNFGISDGISHFGSNVDAANQFTTGSTGSLVRGVGGTNTLFGGGQIGNVSFDVFLTALRRNNLMRMLAEPNLIAISGQEATFLAGGEFPVPVPQSSSSGGTTITIEYKEFGVKLKFTPVVLGNGKIRLKATPEVSDLDFSSGVINQGFRIPTVNKRTVSTTIELAEGQTFALAGLLNTQVTSSKDVTPLLGDLPIIGALFNSVRYERKETELVVLVTPRLVAPLNPDQVPQLPGEKWRYPNEGELFWEHDLGGPVTATAPASTQPVVASEPPKFQGEYGFAPAVTAADQD